MERIRHNQEVKTQTQPCQLQTESYQIQNNEIWNTASPYIRIKILKTK